MSKVNMDNEFVYPNIQPPTYTPQSMPPQSYPMHQYLPGSVPSAPNAEPQTIIISQPAGIPVGPMPMSQQCPACKQNIITHTETKPNTKTHLFALGLCLLGCWCGCCLIPYCTDSCQSRDHTCPNCHAYIGTYDS